MREAGNRESVGVGAVPFMFAVGLCCVVVLCSLNSGADGKVGLGLRSK
jgi:hypothetical protein